MTKLSMTSKGLAHSCAAFLFAAVALTYQPAQADEPLFYAEVIPFATHIGTDTTYEFNRKIDGIAALIPLNRNVEVVALHFDNSFNRPTNILGVSYMPIHLGPVSLGALVGVSNMYAYPMNPVKPLIGAAEMNIAVGKRTFINIDAIPCYPTSWCKMALAIGVQQGIGRR
jgi:hypothetical protein